MTGVGVELLGVIAVGIGMVVFALPVGLEAPRPGRTTVRWRK